MSFDRLTGALQYQIVNTLRWPGLRPVQERAIDAVLDGDNVVVLAPTAGGKTEAAFFPLLSAMNDEDWRPVSVLYLSPIRALLNNQEERVRAYAGLIGRRAFKWHGDVTASARKAFLREPADILLTTPESLEAMLMSTRVPVRELFTGLRAVVIDEIHAFADDDRGAHLAALLERFARYCGKDVQRVGLSATVGNPEEILRWVQGSSERGARVVDPGGTKEPPELSLDYVGSLPNAAHVIKALHPGRKRLVFVDSRRQAEELGKLLNQVDVTTFVTHGSLSATERRDAERAFHEGQDCVIVSTSALELGIDVGDLDHVLQIDSPPSVASFLQRMGRTGRREGTVPNCTFLGTKESAVLQAAALIDLHRGGFVEPVRPSRRASHILAHQLMALCIQLGGVGRGDWWAWLAGATSFGDLTAEERESVVEHMLANGILTDHGGKLWLGERGERDFGRGNFMKLYAVFDTPRLITVRWNTQEIGTVDAAFLASMDPDEGETAFVLAGRPWRIEHIDWSRGVCVVRPAPEGRAARWGGSPRFLSYDLCQAMRRILVGEEEDPAWSRRATDLLTTMRAEHRFLHDAPAPMVETQDEITWWTFAGGAANVLLARMLEAELGGKVISRNQNLTLKDEAGRSAVALRQTLGEWEAAGRPTEADMHAHVESAAKVPVSKFQTCLPEPLLLDLLVHRTFDQHAARTTVSNTTGRHPIES
ncbi:MAG: DEAD/DEAH box helicase [Myxococcota bacterium]